MYAVQNVFETHQGARYLVTGRMDVTGQDTAFDGFGDIKVEVDGNWQNTSLDDLPTGVADLAEEMTIDFDHTVYFLPGSELATAAPAAGLHVKVIRVGRVEIGAQHGDKPGAACVASLPPEPRLGALALPVSQGGISRPSSNTTARTSMASAVAWVDMVLPPDQRQL